MSPSMKRGHRVFLVVAIAFICVMLMGLFPPVTSSAKAEPAPRATGAKDVGTTPGQVNYYANGYPLKPSVLYTFNLSVSYEWNLTIPEMWDYINRERNFNARLYDGTDGQMAVEKIDVWNNQAHWDVADFRFYHRSDRAFTIRGGIDTAYHIYVYTNDDGKVLQHEFGHYGLYFPDEYTDAHGAFCSCTQGTTYNTDEWCWKSNHCTYDWSFCHDQGYGEAKSCWEQLGIYYPNIVVKDPPVAGPYDEPEPTFIWHDKFDFATKDSNMTIWPPKPSVGDTIMVNVTFTNYNYSIDGPQRFDLYDKDPKAGGKLIQSQSYNVRDLPIFTVPFQVVANEGTNTFFAMADSNNTIHEIDETNNVASGQIYVNHRPSIDPLMPKKFSGWEDQPLTVNLVSYGFDLEDTNATLVWNITKYDTKKIVDLKQVPNKAVFTFTPMLYWYGKTLVNYSLTDSAGAFVNGYFDLEYKFVNHRPTITDLTIDTHDTLRGGSANIILRGHDIEDKEMVLTPDIEYMAPGGAWTPLQVSWTDGVGFKTTLDTTMISVLGNYSIKASVGDSDQGDSGWTYLNDTFLVRNNPPQIISVFPSQETVYRTEKATVLFTARDIEDSAEKFTWEVVVQGPDGYWVPFTGTVDYISGNWQLTFAPDTKAALGVYNFRARAVDKDGNYTEWLDNTDGIVVQNNIPTAQYIRVDAKEIYRTKTIQVRASGKDLEQGGAGLKADIQYSYGSAWATDLLSKPYYDSAKGEWVANFTPPATSSLGAISFQAVFTDADGDVSQYVKSDQVQIRNSPPDCRMDGPAKAQTEDKLAFHGSNSTDLEGQLTYQWSFGDGMTSVEANPVHQYKNARTYLVTLTVKDVNGATDSKTINVIITKKPSPPTPFTNPTSGGGSNFMLLLLILLIIVVVICLIAVGVYVSRRNKRRVATMPPRTAVPGSQNLLYDELDGPEPPKPAAQVEKPKDAPTPAGTPGLPMEPVKDIPKEPVKEPPKEAPKVEPAVPAGPPPPGPPRP
jgi:hypothetical protein